MKPTAKRACPECRQPTTWDDVHHPNAWRHDDSNSRWCTQANNTTNLNYPTGCLQPPVAGGNK